MKKNDTIELTELLNQTTKMIEETDDLAVINKTIEDLIISVMDSEYASLWIFDESKSNLVRYRNSENPDQLSMLGQHGVMAKCFLTLSSGFYNYLASEKEYFPPVDNPDEIKIKSKLIVPIVDGDRFLGIVTAYASVMNIRNFDEGDLEIVEAMAPFLIKVIHRMYPAFELESVQRVQWGEHLLDTTRSIAAKVEEIQEDHRQSLSSDEMLGFLSTTVHDIRTPANTLYGFLELLEEQLDNPRLLKYVLNAKESAQFINELTTSILDRVSGQKERRGGKKEQISPTKFFADIAESFSSNMFGKKISFNIYIDPLLAKEIVVSTLELKRVIMNLIGNAYKFTPSRGIIDFSVRYDSEKKRLHIGVKDNGIGIAHEKQQKIFEAFAQAEENTQERYGGTGLGLSISASYVRGMGGELKLESELDKGNIFYVDIPVEVIDAAETFSRYKGSEPRLGILMEKENIPSGKNILRYLRRMGLSTREIASSKSIKKLPSDLTHLICYQHRLDEKVLAYSESRKITLLVVEEEFMSLLDETQNNHHPVISQFGYYANVLNAFISDRREMRVLIADDDQINIELIRAILGEEFCRIEAASDGKSALKMFEKAIDEDVPYDIAYLDKHMPGYAGIEVLKAIRNYEKEKKIKPLLAVSISGDAAQNEQEKQLFDMFVGKPFNKNRIKETLLGQSGR